MSLSVLRFTMSLCGVTGSRTLEHGTPTLQLDDMRETAGKVVRMMRHQHQARAGLSNGFERPGHLLSPADIKAIKRLISDQQLRTFHQRSREKDATEFPIGHLQHALPDQLSKPQPVRQPRGLGHLPAARL